MDEAYLLSREMLEKIHFLLNICMDFESSLALLPNQAIAGRVGMRFHLGALERTETAAYVRRHLDIVKSPREIFTATTLTVIHEFSAGISQNINKVAMACLMIAAIRKALLVDDHLVREVIASEFDI